MSVVQRLIGAVLLVVTVIVVAVAIAIIIGKPGADSGDATGDAGSGRPYAGDPAAESHRNWCRESWAALRQYSEGGSYVNHLTEEGDARVREAYGEETWQRLTAVKDAYDPTNLFRMNQNIPPSGTAINVNSV